MAGWDSYDAETINWDGTIKAKRFLGDGSLLTGVTSSVRLDQVLNPTSSKTFTMGANNLVFTYTNPIGSDGAFEIEAQGAFTGDLVHIHQHTGNPSDVDLLHLEADDADVILLRANGITNLLTIDQATNLKTTGIISGARLIGVSSVSSALVYGVAVSGGNIAGVTVSAANLIGINYVSSANASFISTSNSNLVSTNHASFAKLTATAIASFANVSAAIVQVGDITSGAVVNIYIGTAAAGPTANTTPLGSLYIQYTP